METDKKWWQDKTFWIMAITSLIAIGFGQYYFIFRRHPMTMACEEKELFLEQLNIHIFFVLAIMSVTFIILLILKDYLQSTSFITLVMVVAVILIIPNMFIEQLANATNISCDLGYSMILEYWGKGKCDFESMECRFFSIGRDRMQIVRGVGIGILLLYGVRRSKKEISVWTILKIVLATGIISFLVLHIKAISYPVYGAEPVVYYEELSVYSLYNLIYFPLILSVFYLGKNFLKNKRQQLPSEELSNQKGIGVVVCCVIGMLTFLIAKDRIFDFREYGSIQSLGDAWSEIEVGEYLCMKLGDLGIIILGESLFILSIKKLLKKEWFLFLIIFLIGISCIFYNRCTTYPISYEENIPYLCIVIDRNFRPIQLLLTLLIVYRMEQGWQNKKGIEIREILVVICTTCMGYFYSIPKEWPMKLTLPRSLVKAASILEYTNTYEYLLNNSSADVLHRSLLAFIIIVFILVTCIGVILLVDRREIGFYFNRVEVIVDTCFYLIMILSTCMWVQVYQWVGTLRKTAFPNRCFSLLINLWFSLLIFIAVFICASLITKIRSKVVNFIIVGLSVGVYRTSKIVIGQFLQTALGRNLCTYLADRPNVNGCFVVAESLIRAVAVGIIIFESIRCIKKKITPMQIGIFTAALNVVTLCRYTLDKHSFYKQFPFDKPIYFLNSRIDGDYKTYSLLTIAIGLVPIYFVIKDVFFNKKYKMPSLEKKDILPMTVGVGIVITTCGLMVKDNIQKIQIICRQLYLQRLYVGGTSIVTIVFLIVMGLAYAIKNRPCELLRGKDDKKNEIES